MRKENEVDTFFDQLGSDCYMIANRPASHKNRNKNLSLDVVLEFPTCSRGCNKPMTQNDRCSYSARCF